MLSGILLVVVVGGKMTDVAAVDIDVRCLLWDFAFVDNIGSFGICNYGI